MKTPAEAYQHLFEKARRHSQNGKVELAVGGYAKLIDKILAGVPAWGVEDGQTRQVLWDAAQEWAGMQRWRGNYPEAIQKLVQLTPFFPEEAAALRSSIATYQIEAGEIDTGLGTLLALAKGDPSNIWPWITLAANELWLEKYEPAEAHLKQALGLTASEAFGLASAHKLLFDLYGRQQRLEEAVQAWQESHRLDASAGASVPALLRMLMYWRHFRRAETFIAQEPSEIRRIFYRDLIQFEDLGSSEGLWEWVADLEPAAVESGQDEYAEACLRTYKPAKALAAIEALTQKGEITRQRMLLLGIAWAQKRMLKRATWALGQAVRMADLERPRASRPDGVGGRILDATSRMLYGDCVLHADIRAELDRFFIPQKV
jgi:tetratricopeptide (TPR) repeat protein